MNVTLLPLSLLSKTIHQSMNVLFVSSGNSTFGISPIVHNQGMSLLEKNVKVEFYTIKGKGLWGYIKNIPDIRKKIKSDSFDIIHAHYSLSAFLVTLSLPKIPIIVSLMGSDSKSSPIFKLLIGIFNKFFWSAIIVKSKDMSHSLNLKAAHIIPNGINLSFFVLKEKKKIREQLGLDVNKKYVLFPANPNRYEKNYTLALDAMKKLEKSNIELLTIYNQKQEIILDYMSAADVLLSTSLWEGSPNAIKEAMSINLPVVSTHVGDVPWLFENCEGYFLTSSDVEDVTSKLRLALMTDNSQIKGREQIIRLGLDSQQIAEKIKSIYVQAISE